MNVVVLDEATEEARAAALWYDEQELGVGAAFLSEYRSMLENIEQNPERYPFAETADVRLGIRSARMSRFPYALHYEIRADHALVLAVSHGAQRPNYWLRRRTHNR